MFLAAIALLAAGGQGPVVAKLHWQPTGASDPLKLQVPLRFYGQLGPGQDIYLTDLRTSIGDPVESTIGFPPIAPVLIDSAGRAIEPPGYRLRHVPPQGYAAPAGIYDSDFTTITLGPNRTYVVVAGATESGARMDRICIDWNQDKKFDVSETATLSLPKNAEVPGQPVDFLFAKRPKMAKGFINVKIVLVGNMLALVPTGYYAGTVKMAGRSMGVGIMDANFDGVYGNVLNIVPGGEADKLVFAAGALDLPALIQLPDHRFWQPQASPDGSKLSFTADPNPVGTVAFEGGKLISVEVAMSGKNVAVDPAAGELTLPAQNCLVNARFSLDDAAGGKWNYDLFLGPKFKVESGTLRRIKVNGPLQLGVVSAESGDARSFSLVLRDRADAQVMGLTDQRGQRPPAPTLTIKDSAGKVVHSAAFSYG